MNSRSKGIRGELEVRDLFREHGYDAERGQQHAGGNDSPDVKHSLPGYHVEVKRVEAFNLYNAMAQAAADSDGTGKEPVVFHKKNRKDWVVVMSAGHFFQLVRSARVGESVSDLLPVDVSEIT